MRTRYVFVTGGVCSSLGKGIVAASLARLLKDRGLRVRNVKCDPYLNVDPGTMRPSEHGEVYVTEDGGEFDLDLGSYERFTGEACDKTCSITAGSVYFQVLGAERRGEFLGQTVQAVPHVTGEIARRLRNAATDLHGDPFDVVVAEIGGTVGDIEIQIFLETMRQMRAESPNDVACIHLVLVPDVGPGRELKTKPAQHSVAELRRHGVSPDVLVARSHADLPLEVLHKLQTTCGVKATIAAPDTASIYAVPATLLAQGLDTTVCTLLGLGHVGEADHRWRKTIENLIAPSPQARRVRVGLVAKYTTGHDTYLSVHEAVHHAAAHLGIVASVVMVDAEQIERNGAKTELAALDAVIVPGGFGVRGSEGKIAAAGHAAHNNLPYLGLCLGLQIAVIDAARRGGVRDATSAEFLTEGAQGTPVVVLMDEQTRVVDAGGTMRLGAVQARLEPGSAVAEAYGMGEGGSVRERHRHRYEVDPGAVAALVRDGLLVSGRSERGLVEYVERPGHRFFVATQAHPEFTSRPDAPHPLFTALLRAALAGNEER